MTFIHRRTLVGATSVSPAFVNKFSTAGGGATTTTLVVAYPTSITAGNLLVVVAAVSSSLTGTWTPAAGFAQQGSQVGSGAFITVFTKIATGSETGNATFTNTASTDICGAMLQYSGATSVTSPTSSSGSSTTMSAPSVTPSITGELLLVCYTNQGTGTGGGNVTAGPAGMTQRVAEFLARWQGVWVYEGITTNGIPTGAQTATINASSAWTGAALLVV